MCSDAAALLYAPFNSTSYMELFAGLKAVFKTHLKGLKNGKTEANTDYLRGQRVRDSK